MKIVIPSKSRADSIGSHALALFPEAIVCVDENEADAYKPVTANLLVHPPLPTLASIRNWILDNVDDEIVVQVDDDLRRVFSMVGYRLRAYKKPDEAMQIVENAAEIAKTIGSRLFGFGQSADVKAFKPQDPIRFNGWIGSLVGVVGRDVRWDSALTLRGDIDASLKTLLKHRIIYQDTRFYFETGKRFLNKGGNAVHRSAERERKELAYLKGVWGRYVYFGVRSGLKAKAKTTLSRVPRRQAM